MSRLCFGLFAVVVLPAIVRAQEGVVVPPGGGAWNQQVPEALEQGSQLDRIQVIQRDIEEKPTITRQGPGVIRVELRPPVLWRLQVPEELERGSQLDRVAFPLEQPR